jgi:hypothetical protein
MAEQQFFSPKELCARWRGCVSVGTLVNWRARGTGPAFMKCGSKVIYAIADIEAYEKAVRVGD